MTIETTAGGTIFTGPDVNTFVLIALKAALRMYADTGMRPNRAWTATAMLRKASEFTGRTYKRGQHAIAAQDLQAIYDGIIAERESEAAQQ
jgi:hypothetical protein